MSPYNLGRYNKPITRLWHMFIKRKLLNLYPYQRPQKLIGPWDIWMSFSYLIFKPILVIDGRSISHEIALIWMTLDSADDK